SPGVHDGRGIRPDPWIGGHDLEDRAPRRIDVVAVAHTDLEAQATERLMRIVDGLVAGDVAVRDHHVLVVGGEKPRVEHADVDHRPGRAAGFDEVARLERLEGEDHHAGGEVRQRILERETDGEARGAEYRDQRG